MRIDKLKNKILFERIILEKSIKHYNCQEIYFDTATYAYDLSSSYKTVNNLIKNLVKEQILSYSCKVSKKGDLCFRYKINYTNLFNSLIADITELKEYLIKSSTSKHGKSNKIYGIGFSDLENIFGGTIYAYMNRECIYNKDKLDNKNINKYDNLYNKLITEIRNTLYIGGSLYTQYILPENSVCKNKHSTQKKSPAIFSTNLEHLKIGKRLGAYHIKASSAQIEEYFNKKYYGFKETKILVDNWNKNHADNQIQFNLTIKNNKKGYITSIGIRAYSEICSTTNDIEKNHIAKVNIKPRSKYFKEHNFECVQYFDVHSSIPNVLNWLRTETGEWNNIDWHTKIAKENSIDRDTAKLESMRCLFSYSKNGKKDTLKKQCKYNLEKNCDTADLESHYKSIDACYDIYRNKYKSLLFLYESMAYIRFITAVEKKYNCGAYMVYDCFYFNKQIPETEIVQIMKQCFSEIKTKKMIGGYNGMEKKDNLPTYIENKKRLIKETLPTYIENKNRK